MLRGWAVFALSAVFATQATIGYADRIDGTTADKAFLHLGSARDVTTAGQYFFNIGGVAFSTWVTADGDLVVYSDVIPQSEGVSVSISDGKKGSTPRVTGLEYGKKGYLDSSIMGIMDDADRLRITSLPKTNAGNDRPSRLDATTTHSTLINRILNNQTLGRGSGDNTIQSSWTGTGAAYMKNSTCSSGNRNKPLADHVFHACGNANALHWYPEGQSGFAVDFNGPDNRSGGGVFSYGDEYLRKGSILQLLLRFPRPEPQLQVTKTSDFATTTANLGDDITYTYEIKNAGVTYIENISISDDHRSKGSFTDPNIETATVTTDAHHTGDSVNTNSSNGTWDQLGPGDVLTVTTTYKVTEADIIAYGTE